MKTVSEQLIDLRKDPATQSVELPLRHWMGCGLMIKRFELAAGERMYTHSHLADHYSIVGSGRGFLTVGTDTRAVFAGDVVLVKAGEPHKVVAVEDMDWYCIQQNPNNETDPAVLDPMLIHKEDC